MSMQESYRQVSPNILVERLSALMVIQAGIEAQLASVVAERAVVEELVISVLDISTPERATQPWSEPAYAA